MTDIPILRDIDLICFDVFGTLIEISEPRNPYSHLLVQPIPKQVYRRAVMTNMAPIQAVEIEIGEAIKPHRIKALAADIAQEIASTRLRPGVSKMLGSINLPYVLCSNLSSDYLPAVARFKDIRPSQTFMSCEVGLLKPQPEIYGLIIRSTGVPAGRILFIGDTPDADIDGPAKAGMRSIHINDFLEIFEKYDLRKDSIKPTSSKNQRM